MRIAIVTSAFTPVNTPRAYRSAELAKEFSKEGHQVVVYNAITVVGYNYNELKSKCKFELINLDVMNLPTENYSRSSITNFKSFKYLNILNTVKRYSYFLTTNTWLFFLNRLNRSLSFDGNFDFLISIGLPFHIHWAVSSKIVKGKNRFGTTVADYGDPFSGNKGSPVAFYFRIIEKKVLSRFDYISVPIPAAVETFSRFKSADRIKVIPQGFDMSEIRIANYQPNDVIKFGYAGLFYKKIRNPKLLFDYLCSIKKDFRFIIYTDVNAPESFSCIKPYIPLLGNKLKIKEMIQRENVIFELSKLDFLINIDNISFNQSPSKIIDYGLTRRPVFSMTQVTFDRSKFNQFLSLDFSSFESIDLDKYDIRRVAFEFLSLHSGF